MVRYNDDLVKPKERPLFRSAEQGDEAKSVEEALLKRLNPLIKDGLIDEVLYPVQSGKEAIVYCCRANPSLERDLVAAKLFRPYETRSFKKDAIYQQGRERTSRPNARTLRSLGKKTRRGRLNKFNAWITHEERTLRMLRQAGAHVPAPIVRVGPVILMDYIGDRERPAPIMINVSIEPEEAERLCASILWNVDLFLAHNRVHADLSAYNVLYWDNKATIIDFPQSVDPRYNPDSFALLVRDIEKITGHFSKLGAGKVNPTEHALALWRKHVDRQC
ncbi:hypothetical protein LR032_03190 [Candidatus Bipolaricaulota bacterium]|nr:hypothetical protein [Candidatus Bipolaricaulota bacterium]